jgi:flagellar protein FliS
MPPDVVTDLQQRYLADAIETATPAMRLTMLYDRLVLDLNRADQGFERSDIKLVHDSLVHAQEILITLRTTLREQEWDGAARLAALYDFLHHELVSANVMKNRDQSRRAAELIAQLSDAWHQAAEKLASAPAEVAGGVG